jgi:hypothetical protein
MFLLFKRPDCMSIYYKKGYDTNNFKGIIVYLYLCLFLLA